MDKSRYRRYLAHNVFNWKWISKTCTSALICLECKKAYTPLLFLKKVWVWLKSLIARVIFVGEEYMHLMTIELLNGLWIAWTICLRNRSSLFIGPSWVFKNAIDRLMTNICFNPPSLYSLPIATPSDTVGILMPLNCNYTAALMNPCGTVYYIFPYTVYKNNRYKLYLLFFKPTVTLL